MIISHTHEHTDMFLPYGDGTAREQTFGVVSAEKQLVQIVTLNH